MIATALVKIFDNNMNTLDKIQVHLPLNMRGFKKHLKDTYPTYSANALVEVQGFNFDNSTLPEVNSIFKAINKLTYSGIYLSREQINYLLRLDAFAPTKRVNHTRANKMIYGLNHVVISSNYVQIPLTRSNKHFFAFQKELISAIPA